MENERLQKLGQWAKQNLIGCIMPFWTSDAIIDHENGGFYGRVTLNMEIDNAEPRGLTLAGRMVYAFSTAYRTFGDKLYLERATYAYRDMISRFYDSKFGGAFTSVSAKGEVLSEEKPTYCEAFLLMGCAAYYYATGDKEALRIAKETFGLMETKVKLVPGCYRGNMTRSWEEADGMGFGSKKNAAAFSMPKDAVMFPHHLCQAYVQLYKATGDAAVGKALAEMVQYVSGTLYDAKYHCFKTIVAADGSRIGTRQSFGHDCEISYLLVTAARLTGSDALIAKAEKVCTDVLTHVLENDYDAWGSLINSGDLVTGDKEKSHIWWAQAESVTAMLCGYELTGDVRFLEACERQADYIEKYFVNREHGDWYSNIVVDETGWHIVDGMHGFDKLNGGKCPFHNSQMCFEVMERTARLTKKENGES